MARTVEDLARVLDAIAGFDPGDQRTGVTRLQATDESYVSALDADGLEGARIGVLRERFGDRANPRARPVCDRVEAAMTTMQEAGAELVDPIEVPDLEAQLKRSSLHALQPKHDINAFLAELEDPPVNSIEELYRTDSYHGALELFETIAQAPSNPSSVSTYWQSVAAQESLREALIYVLADGNLDALLFPTCRSFHRSTLHCGPARLGETSTPSTPSSPRRHRVRVSLCPQGSPRPGFQSELNSYVSP